jgi:hypothetical protein
VKRSAPKKIALARLIRADVGPGWRQVNLLATRKREHSRKPDEIYDIIEACFWGPYLELFARTRRPNWTIWGNEAPNSEGSFTGRKNGRAYSDDSLGTDDRIAALAQLRLLEQPPTNSGRRGRGA